MIKFKSLVMLVVVLNVFYWTGYTSGASKEPKIIHDTITVIEKQSFCFVGEGFVRCTEQDTISSNQWVQK